MRVQAKVWALAVFLALAPHAVAQHYGFRALGTEVGLLTHDIQCLYQDRTGLLWVGTQNGLYRYDGGRFTQFGKEQGLPSTSVQAVRETQDGTLWVATMDGLASFNGTRFQKVKLDWNYHIYGQSTLDSTPNELYFAT